jgi:hypothetical protein
MRDRTHNARSSLPAVTAVVALGAIALAWVALRSGEPPVDVILNVPADAPTEPVRVANAGAPAESPAVIKLRELRAMSETYRNTTFVIAIREAGYICHQLLGVHGGVDDAMAWTAACSDMFAYTVRIASSGALAVEPLATYFDGVGPTRDTIQTPRQLQDQLQQLQPAPPPQR